MNDADYPSRSLDRIMVRLPDGMRDKLAEIAKANKRSVNAEVVDRLQKSFHVAASREVVSKELRFTEAEKKSLAEDVAEAILRGNLLTPYLAPLKPNLQDDGEKS